MPFDVTQILVSLLLFAGVFLAIWALFRYPVPSQPPVHRRIAAELGLDQRQTIFENPVAAPVMHLAQTVARRMSVAPIREKIRRDLDASGNPSSYSVEEYLAICVACGVLLACVWGIGALAVGGGIQPLATVAMGVGGFFAPILVLASAADRRVLRIAKQLPYTLDLISIMIAAGSSFTEAVDSIVRDDPNEDLNQELRLVRSEIEFGASRATALSNMAERIPLETLRSIVGAVNQAEALGTPLSTILKNEAHMMRQQRSVRAEKVSASASLRILVPSMLILGGAMVVALGPTMLKVFREGML